MEDTVILHNIHFECIMFHWEIVMSSHGVVDNVLDCNMVVNKFKHQSKYYIYFQTTTLEKIMKPLIS